MKKGAPPISSRFALFQKGLRRQPSYHPVIPVFEVCPVPKGIETACFGVDRHDFRSRFALFQKGLRQPIRRYPD